MSLGSVLQTALSGMSAATAKFDAASHYVANMNTNGFKARKATFAAQPPFTQSAGSGPTDEQGGGNPVQTGTGVTVVGYATDNSQGPLVATAGEPGTTSDGLIELSNTDVGGELVDLILASGQFRASANVFDSSRQLLGELIRLGRR